MHRGLRIGIGAVIIAAAVASAALAFSAGATVDPAADDATARLVTGRYSAGDPIILVNRTLDGGRYTAGYSMDIRVVSSTPGAVVDCKLVEVSGRLASLGEPAQRATSGSWIHLEYARNYNFPDVTVAIACSPRSDGELTLAVRDVKIIAQRRVNPPAFITG